MLQTFDEFELRRAHELAKTSADIQASLSASGVTSISDFNDFQTEMRRLGEQRDRRVLPLAASFLATGVSLGIVTPVLPLLVDQIQLPAQSFGLVVSAFGLARLLGNVPSAALVDRFGKKRVMVWGQSMVALGLGSVGLAVLPVLNGTTWLIGCRFFSGLGVSAFIGGAYLLMADFSTNLNRARTIAPITASFQAGTALGPALGGLAVEYLGITNTYAVTGALFGTIAVLNHKFLIEGNSPQRLALPSNETPAPAPVLPLSTVLVSSFWKAFEAWRELLRNPVIVNICLLNGLYWVTFTGSTWVILPMFLVQTLKLSAAQMGMSFGFSSLVSVLSSQPAAWVTDKVGPNPTLLLGGSLVSASLIALPFAADFNQLLLALLPLSVGSTFLGAVPMALISNLVSGGARTQAMALLRTCADFGLLSGAIVSGMLCEYASLADGFQVNGAILLATISWFAARSYFLKR
jgi:MFS family permease